MSTIYSAGQYDDAFDPKKLGNWENAAKESCPYQKPSKFLPDAPSRIIANSRGHLLPGVPRGDRYSSWGLLDTHLSSTSNRKQFASDTTREATGLGISHRLKKIPKYLPRQILDAPAPDPLLEYIRHLRLPVVWIIGPPTRNTFQKRKKFCKQLATQINYGYINLDEKIQEWKDRQQLCSCNSSSVASKTNLEPNNKSLSVICGERITVLSNPSAKSGPIHSLEGTSIAPSKLPTCVPPFISANITAPGDINAYSGDQSNKYLLQILESQRIYFDTAVPLERQKILELLKFAMAECLPCRGYVMDSVPFDLVEGLQFEKIFYPSAISVYFTEGVPQKKARKPKDRRKSVRLGSAFSSKLSKGYITASDYFTGKDRKNQANVFLKTKSHRRLGNFTLPEGEKICKQFSPKTIRIINAEDVEDETIEFINDLIIKNLAKYEAILEGKSKPDDCSPLVVTARTKVHSDKLIPSTTSSYESSSSSIRQDRSTLLRQLDELEDMLAGRNSLPKTPAQPWSRESSLVKLPDIISSRFNTGAKSSATEVPMSKTNGENDATGLPPPKDSIGIYEKPDLGGGGDTSNVQGDKRKPSAIIWDKIMNLESNVTLIKSPKLPRQSKVQVEAEKCFLPPPTAYAGHPIEGELEGEEGPLPPPTAYTDHSEQEKFTAAIRNCINSNSGERLLPAPMQYQNAPNEGLESSEDDVVNQGSQKHFSKGSSANPTPEKRRSRTKYSSREYSEDSFYG